MFNFEKLEVWQKAIDFADLVYNETRAFPAEERFGLTNQLRRAAISISSNVAEGSSRSSRNDFARFAEIAMNFYEHGARSYFFTVIDLQKRIRRNNIIDDLMPVLAYNIERRRFRAVARIDRARLDMPGEFVGFAAKSRRLSFA